MTSNIFYRITKLSAAALLFIGAGSAVAQDRAETNENVVTGRALPDGARTEYVKYRDINLTTAEGEKLLRSSVKGAAKRVCDYSGTISGLTEALSGYSCYRGAIRGAEPQIANAIINAKNGGQMASLVISIPTRHVR